MALTPQPFKLSFNLPVPVLEEVPRSLVRKQWTFTSPRYRECPKAPQKSPGFRMRPAISAPLRSKTEFLFQSNIGQGAYSEVQRVLHLESKRQFALKVTKPKDVDLEAMRMSVKFQQSLSANGRHPHILPLFDAWEEFVNTETIYELYPLQTGTLQQLLLEITPRPNFLSEAQIWEFVYQIASGLDHIHQCGFIHGDLKPQNILYTEIPGKRFHLRVGDFGSMCRLVDIPEDKAGDATYEAPEVKFPQSDWSQQADIFSFGLIVFEMMFDVEIPAGDAGERDGITLHQLLRMSAHSALDLGMEVNPEPYPRLLLLLRRMLATAPADRPSAAEILDQAYSQLPRGSASFRDDLSEVDYPPTSPYTTSPAPYLHLSDDVVRSPTQYPSPTHRHSNSFSHDVDVSQRKRQERPLHLPAPHLADDDCDDSSASSPVPTRRRSRSISSPSCPRRSLNFK